MDIKEELKKRFRGTVLWVALLLIILLILMSIYGAFIGSNRAKVFFNSSVLSAYWVVLVIFLASAFAAFHSLIRLPGLLLIHAGCVLVLAGGVWGSSAGLKIGHRIFKTDRFQAGRMIIFEGHTENHIKLEDDDQVRELPFDIKLNDFRIEYYKPEYLEVITAEGRRKIPVEVGSVWSLGSNLGTIEISRVFENFKISIEGGRKYVSDDSQTGYNPAVEIRIKNPDGAETTKYVFERFPQRASPGEKLAFRYHRPISDYISDIQIVKDGKVVAEKSIEVNHPLHFGGYHFYQSSYDADAHKYTVLSVVSDTGLYLVYTGYVMLVVGVFWHFWIRHIFTKGILKSE